MLHVFWAIRSGERFYVCCVVFQSTLQSQERNYIKWCFFKFLFIMKEAMIKYVIYSEK